MALLTNNIGQRNRLAITSWVLALNPWGCRGLVTVCVCTLAMKASVAGVLCEAEATIVRPGSVSRNSAR